MYKQFYIDKKRNKHIKEYILITISILVIIISVISIVESLKKNKEILRAEEVKQENLKKLEELKKLEIEKIKKEQEEKLEKIQKEDLKLGLTSVAQKERDNFKYNSKAQEEIDNIFGAEKKEVYLTFDDGPSKNTNAILDVLKEANVKATFFILGTNIKGREKELKRIYNEGHTVANHSFSHRYGDIYKSPKATFEEYIKTEKELKKVLGSDFNSNLFRFPGGSIGGYYEEQKKKSRDFFTKKKIAFVDWNSLTDDSVGADTNKEQLRVFNETRKEKNALVVLQHDSYTSEKTAGTVKLIINQLKKEKYVFKNFNNILLKEDKPKKEEKKEQEEEKIKEDIENKVEENINDMNTNFI